tara:strand:+ start:56 stop:379 length:324 start_codon:yes stop_codon:yes gene_type:complete
MTNFWALQPLKTISQPAETFNISSPNAVINIISILFFTTLLALKKAMPQKNIATLMMYALVFFIILTTFLSENFIRPPDNPTKGTLGATNPFDFSRSRDEREVLTIN